jgi:hypothetical protein
VAGDGPALEDHLAGRRGKYPGDEVKDRGLAGSVRADNTQDLSPVQLYAVIIHSQEAFKRLGEAFDFKQAGIPGIWTR